MYNQKINNVYNTPSPNVLVSSVTINNPNTNILSTSTSTSASTSYTLANKNMKILNKSLHRFTHYLNKVILKNLLSIDYIYPIEINFVTYNMLSIEELTYNNNKYCCYLKFLKDSEDDDDHNGTSINSINNNNSSSSSSSGTITEDPNTVVILKESSEFAESLIKSLFSLFLGDQVFNAALRHTSQIEKLLEKLMNIKYTRNYSLYYISIWLNISNLLDSKISMDFVDDKMLITGHLYKVIQSLKKERDSKGYDTHLKSTSTSININSNNNLNDLDNGDNTSSIITNIENEHIILYKRQTMFTNLTLTINELIDELKKVI